MRVTKEKSNKLNKFAAIIVVLTISVIANIIMDPKNKIGILIT